MEGICTARVASGRTRRRGSVTVLALMVWMLLMLLVTATMALTIVENENVHDYARNKKAFQAADSGVIHGSRTLSGALEAWTMPAATNKADVDEWVADALSGDQGGNRDISLLVTAVDNLDLVLPRNTVSTDWVTEESDEGPTVDYEASVNIIPTGVELPEPGDISYRHTFNYDYEVTSEGEADLAGLTNRATRVERGSFSVGVERPSFATFGYFTDSMKNQYNQQLVFFDGEVYEGRTHVNAAPPDGRCGFWGQAIFNGEFSAVQETYAESFLGGNADPQFNEGAQWGVDRIDLPANGWSQLRASIGDLEHIDDPDPPTINEIRGQLGLPLNGLPLDKGVFYSENNNQGSGLLGGIYVNGDATSIKMDASGTQQTIEIKMSPLTGYFAGAQTWLFSTNTISGTTTVTRNGLPAGTFSSALNGLIHVDGKVLNLKGDGNVNSPDIQSDAEITLSATGDVYVGDHITYETNPTNNMAAKNIFGIYSSNGNIWLRKDAPANLELHATVMAASENKGVGAQDLALLGGYDGSYPNKGKWKLLGGLIEDKNQTTGVFYTSGKITGYIWDFNYDERFAEGAAPPYFPYVTKFEVGFDGIEPGQWGRKYY